MAPGNQLLVPVLTYRISSAPTSMVLERRRFPQTLLPHNNGQLFKARDATINPANLSIEYCTDELISFPDKNSLALASCSNSRRAASCQSAQHKPSSPSIHGMIPGIEGFPFFFTSTKGPPAPWPYYIYIFPLVRQAKHLIIPPPSRSPPPPLAPGGHAIR